MKIRQLLRYVVFGPLMILLLVAPPPLMGQHPSPDGSDQHPSDLRHPLNTWIRREPPGWDLPSKQRRATTTATGLMGKLQSIVIPRIEFRNTTLADAVEFLRQESRLVDPDPDPESRGVNIFLRLPKPSVADLSFESVLGLPFSSASPVPASPATRISLTMERLPLLEALRYVALQAGMKLQIEQYAITIVPLSYVIPTLITAEFQVPPELLGPTPESFCDRSDMTAWFRAKGVNFSPGSSALYLTDKQKLIVRDTQENLDKIVSVISSALKTSANP